MVVRSARTPKLAGVHGYRWTVHSGISVDVRCLADELAAGCSSASARPGLMLLAIRVSTSLQLAVGV
jgi:hypothetical protein